MINLRMLCVVLIAVGAPAVAGLLASAAVQPAEPRKLDGIQVVYRLRVEASDMPRFTAAWTAVTQAAIGRAGARGSALLRDADEQNVVVAIARWRSREDWTRYRSGAPLDPAAAAQLGATSTVISVTVLEGILDVGGM